MLYNRLSKKSVFFCNLKWLETMFVIFDAKFRKIIASECVHFPHLTFVTFLHYLRIHWRVKRHVFL